MIDYADIHWIGVNEFQARQTKAMEREFMSSKPKPSEVRMGFRTSRLDSPVKKTRDLHDLVKTS